jgi:hypothetical protein
VPRVEKVPGSRKAAPVGPEHARDLPARARAHRATHRSVGDEQPPPPTIGPRLATVRHAVWLVLLLSLGAGLAVSRTLEVSTLAEQSLSAGLAVVLAVGLAVRSGGDVRSYAVVAAAIGAAAVASGWDPLLAGSAIATGVLAACLAVLGTRPASRFVAVVVEVVLALALASVGALGVRGWAVDLDVERIEYAVLALAMVTALALVYRLGGGLYGLGRRGLVLSAVATVLLVVVVVYTAALTRYGSPELVDQVQRSRDWIQDTLGGVPQPVEVLVGIPALAWGVSMRSRRRQGWWVCAFGTAATATATTRLVDDGATALSTGLAAGYSIVLGLLLGFVLIRLEQVITFSRDRRTTHAEHVATVREEPGRMQPLH